METTNINFKLIRKIKDDKFDVDSLHQYVLLLNLGVRDLQISVVDETSQRCLLLEDYVFDVITSFDQLQQLLISLFDSHHLVMAGFWKEVRVAVKNHKFIQVPQALYMEEAASDYLKFNARFDEKNEMIFSFSGIQTDAVTVFAFSKTIYQWLKSLYPNTKLSIVHQSNALIESVLNYYGSSQQTSPVYIYIDRFKLHIMVVRNKQLVYYNQFVIKQFSDYVKYIMLVMNGLKIDQKKSEVVLWGYLGKSSAHYHEFYKYINNVAFGERAKFLKFGYIFDEIQDHHFMDLYGLYLCKS